LDRKIGVFFQPKIPGAVHWAAAVRDRLAELGFEGWVADVNAPPSPLEADLIITLGGDGTILAVARLAAPLDIPILPVNLGRLGFMAEFDPHQLLAQLPELLRGDGWVERRRLLTATLTRSGAAVREVLALNDIVISRGSVAGSSGSAPTWTGLILRLTSATGLSSPPPPAAPPTPWLPAGPSFIRSLPTCLSAQ